MFSFAGVLGETGDVLPELNCRLEAFGVSGSTQLHCAYLGSDGDAGSILAPAARLGVLLPKAQAVMVSAEPTHETMWAVSDAFAALCSDADASKRSATFDAALLSRLAGAFLHRGVSAETAVTRALDKFPSNLSTLFLLRHNKTPQLVASRRGPPIWIHERARCVSVVGATSLHAKHDALCQPIQLGDTITLEPGRSALVDVDGMRMEKRSHGVWGAETMAQAT